MAEAQNHMAKPSGTIEKDKGNGFAKKWFALHQHNKRGREERSPTKKW